jgi:hypothetical protein
MTAAACPPSQTTDFHDTMNEARDEEIAQVRAESMLLSGILLMKSI